MFSVLTQKSRVFGVSTCGEIPQNQLHNSCEPRRNSKQNDRDVELACKQLVLLGSEGLGNKH